MRYFDNLRLPILALLVPAALIYFIVSVVSLFANVSEAKAGTAPAGSFHAVQIDENNLDYVYNWDFNSNSAYRENVDWGMRFVFAGSVVDVDYVKLRLRGDYFPPISPALTWPGGPKYALMGDGAEHTGSNWDSDSGFKDYPGCQWNFGHMRVYAQTGEDYNVSPTLGNYVVASTHVDKERGIVPWFFCDTQYRSLESDENEWEQRIRTGLSVAPYNWSIGSFFNWRNESSPFMDTVNLTVGNHRYQSDGDGKVINVGQTY